MIELVRIRLRPKIFGSLDLQRSLFGHCKSCVFGKDIFKIESLLGIQFELHNGPEDVRTRRKF